MPDRQVITSPKSPHYRELRNILVHPIRSEYALVEGYNAYNQLLEDKIPFEVYLEENQPSLEGARYLSTRLFDNIVKTKTYQGILCKVKKIKRDFDDGPILLLDRVQDPGNVGTLLRSAQAFNIRNILLIRGSCSVYNDKVLRSSMAAVFNLAIEELVTRKRVEELLEEGYKLYAAEAGGRSYKELKRGRFILALGNESQGLSQEILELKDESYSIPMSGSQESLNVAVAGSIFMCQIQD